MAAVVWGTAACQADQEPLHEDNTIHEIMMISTSTPEQLDGRPLPQPVLGRIDQEAGTIEFAVPKKYRTRTTPEGKKLVFFDLTRVKLRATVGYDVRITPSLFGIKDLSEKFEFEVLATQTGKARHYSARANFSRQ